MEVWAEAMRALSQADENTDLALVLKVLNENNTIPVVVLDSDENVTDFRNVTINAKNYKDSLQYVSTMAKLLKANKQNIRISLSGTSNDYIDVCYDDSLMLKRLALYPYVPVGCGNALRRGGYICAPYIEAGRANKVWVGLSKETAHQLGTPIFVAYGVDYHLKGNLSRRRFTARNGQRREAVAAYCRPFLEDWLAARSRSSESERSARPRYRLYGPSHIEDNPAEKGISCRRYNYPPQCFAVRMGDRKPL